MNICGVILSDNQRFARMLQHELSHVKIFLDVISDEAQIIENETFQVVLADLDFCGNGMLGEILGKREPADLQNSERGEKDNSVLVIGWSRIDTPEDYRDYNKCSAFFTRPFLMADLRYIVSEYFSADNVATCHASSNNRHEGDLTYAFAPRITSEMNSTGREENTERKLICDKESKTAHYGDMKFTLSEYEYKTLSLLCEKRGEVVTREEIEKLLNFDSGNMGDVYICHLRKKIDNNLGLKLITTVRGKGYMLK